MNEKFRHALELADGYSEVPPRVGTLLNEKFGPALELADGAK